MGEHEIRKFFWALKEYLDRSYNRENLKEIMNIIKGILQENDSISVYNEFARLIYTFEIDYCKPTILILKNEGEKFDIFAFKNGITLNLDNLVSSENFLKRLRETSISGYVISDIEPNDILNFLKAYYIYRKEPKQDKSAQNIVYNYNNRCLHMASILENYNGISDNSVELTNIILYDDSALPYSLEYLNDYKRKANNRRDFSEVLQTVKSDKYLGLNLRRVSSLFK